jgi:urease gamma subunit
MADVKPIPSSGFNLFSINGVLNTINSAFLIPDTPVEPLPPPLIMFGAKLRPGLSAQSIAANIISRQSESGRVVGDVFADGPNVEEAMEVIRVQEIINALLNEAKIEVVIPPGVQVQTVGVGNLGAPVLSQGATTSMGIGDGVIR